jgi:ElaB/YqjD/DUF883 family membrane-anchored ribosome-binding protein
MPDNARDAMGRAEDAMAQITRLREQVESLMRDRVSPAMGEAAERVEAAAHDAADVVRGRADVLAGVVRGQPLAAIGIAAVLGFLLGRIGR